MLFEPENECVSETKYLKYQQNIQIAGLEYENVNIF